MLGRAWRCSICLLFLCLTLRTMMRHIYSHSAESNFHIECGIDGCPAQYRLFDSYRKHVYRRHSDYLDKNVSQISHDSDEDDNEVTDAGSIVSLHSLNEVDPSNVFHLEDISAQLVMELKYKDLLPQNAVNKICSRGSLLLQQAQEDIVNKLKSAIDNATSKDDLHNLVDKLKEEILSTDPFDVIKTPYLQKKYISERYDPVMPEKIILGETVTRKRKHGELTSIVKEDCFYYITLRKSIKQMVKNDKIFNLIFEDTHNHDEYVQDIFNGTAYKEHSLSESQYNLFLSLYYDDFEICNPLGSKSHKLGMFYYSVLNFPLQYRSKLCSVKLLAVVYRNMIDKYGIDKVLSPFVQELKQLYHGEFFQIQETEIKIHVALLNVIGDTPANNLLGGFKEGVGSSLIKCRQCYCDNELMQSKFSEEDFLPRVIDRHLLNCAELENSATKQMRSYLSTLFGINRKSILTEVPEFDVCQNMPEDFMHVFLEGVAQYEIKEILKHYILEPNSQFSMQDFNQKMKLFPYGYDDLDKRPSPILLTNLHANDNRIRQSASQMLVFLRIIPFILQDLVNNVNDYHLKFLGELLDIYHILFCPFLSVGTMSFLQSLIMNHLNHFKSIFPNLNIIPKQHFMIHFPMLMKRFGPAIRNWCMRFEAKHKQCKGIASKQNFANLPLSIAESLQFSDSIDFHSENGNHPLFSNDFIIRNSKILLNEDKNSFLVRLKSFYNFHNNEIISVHKSNHVTLNSFNYIKDKSFLVAEAGEILPEFGIIRNIFVVNQKDCFFELQMYLTVNFDNDYKSYCIELPTLAEGFVFKRLEEIVDTSPYSSVETAKGLFIPLKYSLDDLIRKYNKDL